MIMNKSLLSQQITKQQIDNLKNDIRSLSYMLKNANDSTVIYMLEKLGKLKNDHYKELLLNLLKHRNPKIRCLAIKNLAKIGDVTLLKTFFNCANQDQSTDVRRESTSAIGRLMDEKTIPFLLKLLSR